MWRRIQYKRKVLRATYFHRYEIAHPLQLSAVHLNLTSQCRQYPLSYQWKSSSQTACQDRHQRNLLLVDHAQIQQSVSIQCVLTCRHHKLAKRQHHKVRLWFLHCTLNYYHFIHWYISFFCSCSHRGLGRCFQANSMEASQWIAGWYDRSKFQYKKDLQKTNKSKSLF